jgi:hypothetical protein
MRTCTLTHGLCTGCHRWIRAEESESAPVTLDTAPNRRPRVSKQAEELTASAARGVRHEAPRGTTRLLRFSPRAARGTTRAPHEAPRELQRPRPRHGRGRARAGTTPLQQCAGLRPSASGTCRCEERCARVTPHACFRRHRPSGSNPSQDAGGGHSL